MIIIPGIRLVNKIVVDTPEEREKILKQFGVTEGNRMKMVNRIVVDTHEERERIVNKFKGGNKS